MSTEIKVVVVDDHPLFRRGVVDAINSELGMNVVGEETRGVEVFRLIKEKKPNVLILDFELPGESGLDVVKELRRKRSQVPIVMLTMYRDEKVVNEALNAGVNGYVLKEDSDQEIVHAIRAVHDGRMHLAPSLSSYMANRMRRTQSLSDGCDGLNALSDTEWKVLKLVAANCTSPEIAAHLFISTRTVQKHRENMCGKLNLHGPHKLLEFALKRRDEIHHGAPMANGD